MATDIRRVCKFCKLKCFKEQCRRDSDYNCLSFFKVIDKESNFSSLEIPSQCVEEITREGCRCVLVEAPSGCLYKIVLCCSDFAILKDGWQKFAASESLELGDIVVFTMLRDTHFIAQIFETSGNEKKINKVSCYADEDKNARPKKRMRNRSTKEASANEKQINKVTYEEEEQIIQESTSKERSNKSKEENFISPTFSKVLPKSAVRGRALYLEVPSGFGKRWLPEEKLKVLLSCGTKKWSVTLSCYSRDGTGCGPRFELYWKYFVVDNQLKEGDTCFFELKGTENHLEFVVKIDRA